MKIIIALCMAMACLGTGMELALAADSVWLEAQYNLIVYDDTALEHSGEQYKVLLGWRWLYLYASQDSETNVVWGGQRGPGFQLASLGAGIRIPLGRYVSAYLDAGRYFVTSQDDKTVGYTLGGGAWESYTYYAVGKANEPVPNGHFDYFKTSLSDAWGGQVGVNVHYPLWFGFEIGATAGYRYLKLERETTLRWEAGREPAPGAYWIFQDQQDCGGWLVGTALTYAF